jgi:dipeptidyl aminopeptidase/acylaminoacyl peptidase
LPDTEDGQYPFWSPDSQYLAFFTAGKMKKIKVSSGASQTICEAPDGRGGAWNQDGNIVFAPQPYGGLSKVPSAGGRPEPVTQASGPKVSHRWPSFLPDGRHFLYLSDDPLGVSLASLNSKETKVLIPNEYTNGIYAEPGYILFFRDGSLTSQPFDAKNLKLKGEPFPLLEEKINYTPLRGLTAFSVSKNGIFAYQPQEPRLTRLVWRDSSGKEIDSAAGEAYDRGLAPPVFMAPRISPDGSKICLRRWDRNAGKYDLWILQTSTRQFTRFTVYRDVEDPGVWSPDQSRIAYISNRTLFVRPVSGAESERRIIQEDRDFHPQSCRLMEN